MRRAHSLTFYLVSTKMRGTRLFNVYFMSECLCCFRSVKHYIFEIDKIYKGEVAEKL